MDEPEWYRTMLARMERPADPSAALMDQIKRDLLLYGNGFVRYWRDANGTVRVERLDPKLQVALGDAIERARKA